MFSLHLILFTKENVFFCRGGSKTSYFNSNIVLYNIKNWNKNCIALSVCLDTLLIIFRPVIFKHGHHMLFVYITKHEVKEFNFLWTAILAEIFFSSLPWIKAILKFQDALLGSDILQYSKYIGVSEEHAASTLRVEMCNSDGLKVKITCLFKAVCLSTRLHTQSSTP
jgi:hypothetical protein